jgi:acetyl-CoA carboxylase carboxyltransferase component
MPTKIMIWNQALAQSTVPKISVVIRKSVGAAYGNRIGRQDIKRNIVSKMTIFSEIPI